VFVISVRDIPCLHAMHHTLSINCSLLKCTEVLWKFDAKVLGVFCEVISRPAVLCCKTYLEYIVASHAVNMKYIF